MPNRVTTAVRCMFASVAATALVVAGLEAAAARHDRIGIRSCGWEGNPCALSPLVVTAPAPVMVAVAGS